MKKAKPSKSLIESVADKATEILSDSPARTNAQAFEVLQGLNYGDTRRESGEIATDIPAESISWLIECGAIRPLESEQK